MANRKIIIMLFLIMIGGMLVLGDNTFLPSKVFDFYCEMNGDDRELYDVDTHGKRNVNFLYLYLYNKGLNITRLLENKFLDESPTNLFFHEFRMKKGDVAWFLYRDIKSNDTDIAFNIFSSRYNIPGVYLFLQTVANPLLRKEYLDIVGTLE